MESMTEQNGKQDSENVKKYQSHLLFTFKQLDPYDNTSMSLLFKVKKNQVRMVERRGFDVSNEAAIFDYNVSNFVRSYTEFGSQYNKTFRQSLNAYYANADGNHIYVYYVETPQGGKQIKIEQIRDLMNDIDIYKQSGYTITNIIILSELPLSSGVRKEMEKLPSFNFEYFNYDELSYDPTEHYLVPRHEILTSEEARTFLRKNRVKFNQLPIISIYEPIAKYYGAKSGQIMRVYRDVLSVETLVGSYITYRAVRDVSLDIPKPKSAAAKKQASSKK